MSYPQYHREVRDLLITRERIQEGTRREAAQLSVTSMCAAQNQVIADYCHRGHPIWECVDGVLEAHAARHERMQDIPHIIPFANTIVK